MIIRIATAIAVICVGAHAGDTTPPAAPVAPTMKTLDRVEPRTPVGPDTTPGGAGVVYWINAPGSYYLTEDVVAAAGEDGIRIDASFVTLDLNGFALRGVGDSTKHGIRRGFNNHVVVRNGIVTGWGTGVSVPAWSTVENVTVDDNVNGIVTLESSTVRDCIATNHPTGNGIEVGPYSHVQDCQITTCEQGILTSGVSSITGCTAQYCTDVGINAGSGSIVADCTASLNTGFLGYGISGFDLTVIRCNTSNNNYGILINGYGNIRDCFAIENAVDGILAPIGLARGLIVSGCTARGNAGNGIVIGHDSTAIGNTSSANGANGIQAGDCCLITGNTATGNASGSGIESADTCRITDNLFNQNLTGITAADACTIEGNTAAHNADGIIAAHNCRISNNNSESNTAAGFIITGRESLFESNRFSNNQVKGLLVQSDRNCILRNINRLSADPYDIVADNRVGFTIIPPLSGAISGDTDPDAIGAGTTDPWANFSH